MSKNVKDFIAFITGNIPIDDNEVGNNSVTIINSFRSYWDFAPTGDYQTLTIKVKKAPNLIHRVLQYLFFGFKYRKSA